jgi:hypothetical protein
LRLLKLLRFFNEAVILTKALTKSAPALRVPAFAILIAATVFGSFVFALESIGAVVDPEGPPAAFDSIPHTMWFMFVTMTTIGYGDVSPNTHLGKAFTVPVMVFGVLLISMPLAVVGNNFTEVWAEKDKVIFVSKLRELIEAQHHDNGALKEAFRKLDTDNSGTLSFKEFKKAMITLQIEMPANDVLKLWQTIDVDNSNEVLVTELLELMSSDSTIDLHLDRLINPLFKMPEFALNHTHAYSNVNVDEQGCVHFRAEGDRDDLPNGSCTNLSVQWLLKGKITAEKPPKGIYAVDAVDEDNFVHLIPTNGGLLFSFENPTFVFARPATGALAASRSDKVHVNTKGGVDTPYGNKTGYQVDWRDSEGNTAWPYPHPAGCTIIDISEDEVVTLKDDFTEKQYTFKNPIRHDILTPASENIMTMQELESRVGTRLDKIEAALEALSSKLDAQALSPRL